MSYALLQNERFYLVKESTYGTVPSISGSNSCRFTRFTLNPVQDLFDRNDKTGTRSASPTPIRGRRHATWEVVMDLAGSGVAGQVPDSDPLWVCTFGQAATGSGSTKTYALTDDILSLSMASYKYNPDTLNSRLALGAIVSNMRIAFGGNINILTVSGEALWSLDKDFFSSADLNQKGGLGSFPAEPGSQTYNGAPMVGFTGQIQIAGDTVAEIQDGTLNIGTANELVKNTFGEFEATTSPIGGRRSVGLDFRLFDADTTAVQDIRNASLNQTPVVVSLQLGTIAGNILTLTLPNVYLSQANYGENDLRFDMTFSGNRCLPSGVTSLDEVTAVWS